MTPKDFELIANALSAARDDIRDRDLTGSQVIDIVTMVLADSLPLTSPSFGRELFIAVSDGYAATDTISEYDRIVNALKARTEWRTEGTA
jgi:hypothetical protein